MDPGRQEGETRLADRLLAERDAIVALFTRRVEAAQAPAGATRSQLVDCVPRLLEELAAALRAGNGAGARAAAKDQAAASHGEQRQRHGFDLGALIREYGILRACVFDRLEASGFAPSLSAVRSLTDHLEAALAESVEGYLSERRVGAEAERRNLLGLFQQAPGFVAYLQGPEKVFELANDAYFQLVGHREILGKPVREALPEVAGQGFFELLDRVYATGEPYVGRGVKVRIQRAPEATLTDAYVDFVYQPIRGEDGAVAGVLSQGTDVTPLRASEERYRTLFESIDDGFCLMQLIFDVEGQAVDYRFLETNAAFERQTGLEDAVGRTASELVPDLDASWFQLYGRVATTGEPARFENHAPAMGRWFDVYANRVGRPELRQIALVFKDVTDRKRTEEERERLLVLESSARLEAETASRLKDEFLATVSHELRTPLTSMLGWVQMLRGRALPADKWERALETIERNARMQAQLIEDLLDVSRILAGKLRLEVGPVDVRAVVEAALDTVRPAADARGIVLHTAMGPGATVIGDARRLQQVVWNLLSNAVKFTPAGGRVEVALEPRGESVEIAVSDTGQGIEPRFLPHVFERFRQADAGTTRAHGGLGLGLSIVSQLVELHGGSVGAESEGVNRGSRFTVRLPLAAAARLQAEAEAGAERGRRPSAPWQGPASGELEGLHVLVVDDEDDAREMMGTLLQLWGARVSVAASAAEALRFFGADPPGLLISDIGMPDEDGYDLLEQVRRLPPQQGGEVPAVALSAYARPQDRARALFAGFSSHVPKPVEPMELLAVIGSLTGRTGRRPS